MSKIMPKRIMRGRKTYDVLDIKGHDVLIEAPFDFEDLPVQMLKLWWSLKNCEYVEW